MSQDGGRTWKTLESVSVVRDGRQERVQDRLMGSFFGDQWRENEGTMTSVFDPSECRTLSGWDPEHPPRVPLIEADVDRVRGAFVVPPSFGPQGWTHRWKGQSLLMVGAKSLRELIQECSVRSLEKEADPKGGTTWKLKLHPKKAGAIQYYQVSLSSRNHYLISRQESSALVEGKSSTGYREVVEFSDFGSGLVLPRLIRTTVSDRPDAIYELELKDVQLNQPIRESFTLEFPEGAIVVDQRSQKYHVWGIGSPERTFASQDEFNAWNQNRQRRLLSQSMKRKDSPIVQFGLLAASGIGLLGLIYYRRKVTRARA